MQKPILQTILISILIIIALFTSIYFPYKWKQLSNDFLDQTNQYGELLKQINDLQREVRDLRDGEEKNIVISPNKGDVWIIGEVYQIRWTPNDSSKKITIQLLDLKKRGTYQAIWSQEVPNNGIYQFTIPLDLYPVEDAQFYIGNNLKSFFSEGFSIISKDEIVDWKIYRNEEYGFEINYPQIWIILHEGYYMPNTPYEVSFTSQDIKDDYIGAAPISIIVKNMNLKEAKKTSGMVVLISEKKIIVNNIISEKQIFDGPEGKFKRILIPKEEELIYELRYNNPNFEKIFNQMLPTFKFIDQNNEF